MGKLENSTISMTIFLMLFISFGAAVGGPDVQTALNNVFGPWPSIGQSVQTGKCSALDIICNANNLNQATANIAAAIYYPATLFFNVLSRINAFGVIVTTVVFGPQAGISAIPFGALFFIGVVVLPASYEIFRMFRGNSSGSTL